MKVAKLLHMKQKKAELLLKSEREKMYFWFAYQSTLGAFLTVESRH